MARHPAWTRMLIDCPSFLNRDLATNLLLTAINQYVMAEYARPERDRDWLVLEHVVEGVVLLLETGAGECCMHLSSLWIFLKKFVLFFFFFFSLFFFFFF